MKRLVCRAYGEPPELSVAEEPDRASAPPDHVLVAISAAKVSFVDRLLVQGRYQVKPAVPFTPGSVGAGEVLAVGDGVDPSLCARRVALLVPGYGAFATQVVVPAWAVVPLPDSVTELQAAVAIEAYGTASFALEHRTRLEPGERVVVLGASGAVGHAAADLASSSGAEVVCVTARPEQCRAALPGVTTILDRTAGDLREELRARYPDGVDVIVDPVGGDLAWPALRSLGHGGRYLVVGFASGDIPAIPLNHVLLRNRTVLGVEWGGHLRAEPSMFVSGLASVFKRIASGALRPLEPQTVSLAALPEILAAHGRTFPELTRTVMTAGGL